MVSLFNDPRFHALNAGPGERSLTVVHEDDGRVVGALAGVVDGTTFTSGHSAPFGGPDFARDRETAAAVQATVEAAVADVEREGVRTIRIRAKPPCSTASEPLVTFALLNAGFAVERCELNHHVDLRGLSSTDDYLATLKSPARRALRHLEGAPFSFAEAEPGDEPAWERGYGVLEENRRVKGRGLSIDLPYVRRVREAFPGRVRLFELFHAGAPCAAALLYRVHPGHELVVSWGDARHALERSPMNLLALRVVEWAIATGAAVLDLGISTEPGTEPGRARVQEGLARFKLSVGARAEPRFVLLRQAA